MQKQVRRKCQTAESACDHPVELAKQLKVDLTVSDKTMGMEDQERPPNDTEECGNTEESPSQERCVHMNPTKQ